MGEREGKSRPIEGYKERMSIVKSRDVVEQGKGECGCVGKSRGIVG